MYIYCATNKLNGKQYVGLTTKSVGSRWETHVRDSKSSNTVMGKALRKYGSEAFIVVAIDIAETEAQLSHKEKFWIAELGTAVPNGYNLKEGGFFGKATPALQKRLSRSAHRRFTKVSEREAQSTRISEYFSKGENRRRQSVAIKAFFDANPQRAEEISNWSKDQWVMNRDQIIARQKEGWKSPESKIRAKSAAVKRHQTDAYKSKKKPVTADGIVFESISECADYFSVACSHVRVCANESRPMKNGVVVEWMTQE